ncbi:hypothetical protein Hanom_Chr16g01432811 [Helianthus anomalus]
MVKPKQLHNFDLPPGLTWGSKKFLRCSNFDPVPAMPDDDESSDSDKHNNTCSVENIHAEVKEVPRFPAEDRSEKKPSRPRRNLEKKEERPKFSIALSRKEIEEDFIAMTGKKPPRKPNKPPRSVQMKLDALTPGLWLSEVNPDRYKVDENRKI